jgi:hypothetical protein
MPSTYPAVAIGRFDREEGSKIEGKNRCCNVVGKFINGRSSKAVPYLLPTSSSRYEYSTHSKVRYDRRNLKSAENPQH